MANITVTVDQLANAIDDTLKAYNKNVTDKLKTQARQSMSKLVKITKQEAPKSENGKNQYYKSITSKKTSESEFDVIYTWYVKGSNYRLSHLLEDGHKTRRIRNGKEYTKAFKFISSATDEVTSEYIKKVEEILKNG